MTELETENPFAVARRLLRGEESGVLSTQSIELAGYPFGSVTPFVLTHEGCIVIYVSRIAQHTANMEADERSCFTVVETGQGNQQALGRVSVLGDARRVPEAEHSAVAERYFRFFPGARDYGGTHAFDFYGLHPRRVRYIGGFGRIFWIEPAEWTLATPAWAAQEQGIVEHMNEDHGDFVQKIARRLGLGEPAEFLACDPEGCHLRSEAGVGYAGFAQPAHTSDDVRAQVRDLG